MLKIVIKNEYGSFEMGGGSHKNAQILETSGFGLPSKEMQSVTFSGQAGITPTSVRDLERTLTISLSFYGGQRDVERLYRILYREADIYCTFGTRRRKIHGICINPEAVSYTHLDVYKRQPLHLKRMPKIRINEKHKQRGGSSPPHKFYKER